MTLTTLLASFIALKGNASPSQIDLAAKIEEFRQAVVICNLTMDNLLGREFVSPESDRLKKLSDPDMWPRLLGTDVPILSEFKYRPESEEQSDDNGLVTAGPFASKAVVRRYLTWILDKGIETKGTVICKSYANMLCFGPMSGKMRFESYGNAFVKGDVDGELSASSYFTAYISGNLKGSVDLTSSSTIFVMGRILGVIEGAKRTKIYVGGHTTEMDLARIKGDAMVTLGSSDLSVGEHTVGRLKVKVLSQR